MRSHASVALRHAVARAAFARGGPDVTHERVSLEALGLDHPDRAPYVPSAWWVLRWQLPTRSVRQTDVFVEFGCGKGRIVFDAARRYPFARIVGVELSDELSDVARTHIDANRSRLRCADVRIETCDAASFPIPDDMTHAYFFNPFVGPTFERVCSNIVASLDRAPRPLTMIYVQPEEHDTLVATGRFRVVRRVRTTRLVAPTRIAVYQA